MSHWFHRNPLKATGFQNFEVKMFAHDSEALKIISDLKQSRARLIELLPDPHHTIEQMETALKLYMALLRGFLLQPGILVSLRSTFLFFKSIPIISSNPCQHANLNVDPAKIYIVYNFCLIKENNQNCFLSC